MKISAKIEYACIAVLELSRRFAAPEPVRIRQIAVAHGIPSRFLVQILLQLKSAGFVASTRGAAGGYRLAMPPGEITLGAVMAVVDGQDQFGSNTSASSSKGSVLADTWQEIANVERDMLESVTFAQLAERSQEPSESMYYI